MATITGTSGQNANGGYLESRLTYSVSGNSITFTKLEIRKQPSSLTTATSGTWYYSVRCGWNNVVASGSISVSVLTSWKTLWSGSKTEDITDDTTIYGVVDGPSNSTYSGLTATAETDISYKPLYDHEVTIQHWYDGSIIDTDTEYVIDYGQLPLEEYIKTSEEYSFSHAEIDGQEIPLLVRITKDTVIDIYYEKLIKWTVTDKTSESGILGGTYDFPEYQIYRWYYYASESGQVKFETSGNEDTIGWISNSTDWAVDDNGYPKSGYYLEYDDDGGNGSNFSLTYNVTKGKKYYLYASIYQAESASDVVVSISTIKDSYKINMVHSVKDSSFTGGYRQELVESYTFDRGKEVSPKDYVSPEGLDSSYILLHVDIRGTQTLASNISTLSYTINDDEDWNFYYRPGYWNWNAANRTTSDAATAAQTTQAYEAITEQGLSSNFSYKVWNDLCAVTKDVLTQKSYTWDTTYATYNNTLMSETSKTLTAVRFNSLRKNIDKLYSTGISVKTKYNGVVTDSNKVIGNDFIILTDCLNKA